jgi:pimeloyl-ACP methyl ester carboxylesterase
MPNATSPLVEQRVVAFALGQPGFGPRKGQDVVSSYGSDRRLISEIGQTSRWEEVGRAVRAAAALTVTAMAGAAAVGVAYGRDRRRLLARLCEFNVRAIDTPVGKLEYGTFGDGPPALLVHGVVGGWDAPPTWRIFVPPRYQTIAPARFGYLGSALPPRATPALQADAFVSLMDALEIAHVPVIAFSAGSSSAVQLAIRHPSRVSGLVLACANAPHPKPLTLPPRFLAPVLFSEPSFWALRRLAPHAFRRIAGFPANFVWDEQAEMDERDIIDSFFPVDLRTPGILFDAYASNPAIATFPLEEIRVPTLVINAPDDPLAPYEDARRMAERIPNARFISVPSGGHVFMHRHDPTVVRVREFVTEVA